MGKYKKRLSVLLYFHFRDIRKKKRKKIDEGKTMKVTKKLAD